jgi:hypothetical protein
MPRYRTKFHIEAKRGCVPEGDVGGAVALSGKLTLWGSFLRCSRVVPVQYWAEQLPALSSEAHHL